MFSMFATARVWRWAKLNLKNKIYERTYSVPLVANRAADLLEHFHDGRLVRAFEIQEQAAVDCHSGQLGHRVF